MDTLGARAKAARDHLGLKRREVSERLGTAERPATLIEIEEDRVEPGAERTAALAEVLGVDCAWLITGKAESAPAWLTRPRATKPEAAA